MSGAKNAFLEKYGPWGVVAGASNGLGAAFAAALAERGLNLLLIARRRRELEEFAFRLSTAHRIGTRTVVQDLAHADTLSKLQGHTQDIEVGLVVYNAAVSNIGPFLSRSLEDHQRLIDVNVRGPMICAHYFGHLMERRGKGGIVLMSSLTAMQGTPYIAHYGATKGYNLLLAEGLWYEFREKGIDVVACCAGATDTPNFRDSVPPDREFPRFPPVMKPEKVVRIALRMLGERGSVVTGWVNRAVAFLMGRILSRKAAVTIMGNTTRVLYL
jgi:short-subunit dehydrogenase